MNDNAKVFSLVEMREMMIDTSNYQMMEEVGEFTGTLEMKAQGHKKSIRIFLTLDDGRKIITPRKMKGHGIPRPRCPNRNRSRKLIRW